MRFRIRRTSNTYHEEHQPCDGTEPMLFTENHCGYISHFSAAEIEARPEWHNMRTEGNYRLWDEEVRRWVMDFTSLEDLLRFIAGQGGQVVILIDQDTLAPSMPVLEIYDDYRE